MIKTWRNLRVWQAAHELTLMTYRLTRLFPSEERFALSSQMRRAAASVATNIVEGFHRRTLRDSLSFYNIADASLEELRYEYVLARDLEYFSGLDVQEADQLLEKTGKLLGAWMSSQRQNVKVAATGSCRSC